MIREGLALYGTMEFDGNKSNPIIVNWAKETNNRSDDWYNNDSIPWCSLYAIVVAQRAGKDSTNVDLSALSWKKFGKVIDISEAALGDVLIFSRKGGGHVGFYVGEDNSFFYVLGGNQSNKVNIAKISKNRCVAVRRPIYNKQPESVKKIFISGGNSIKESKNEQ